MGSELNVGDILKKRISQDKFDGHIHVAILNLLVAADSFRSAMEAICAEGGIGTAQYNILRILKGAHPNGHSRGEILRRMLERSPDVTRLVDRLEKDGMVERDRSESDRRLSITRITGKGIDLLRTLEPAVKAMLRRLGKRIDADDCENLSRVCEKIYGDEL